MLSDFRKSAFKMASGNPQKNIAKKYEKTWNCPASLSISEALTIQPTNFLNPLFDSQFFLSFTFHFGHKTLRALKHEKTRSISEALTIHSTNFKSPLFDSQFFLSFNFYFGHKTLRGLKHEKNRPTLFICVFLIENSCLNCLKEERIQDYEKTKLSFFFICW